MRRSIFAVVFALAVVLAGCNGIAFGDEETSTPAVTPAAVPTDEPTPTPVPQLAPGLTGTGVTDAFALGEAHATVLDDSSFTLHRENVVRYTNGTPYQRVVRTARLGANGIRYYVAQNSSGEQYYNDSEYSSETWSDGERVIVRRMTDGSTSYRMPHDLDGNPGPARVAVSSGFTNDEAIYTLFGAVETRVTGRERRNGTTLYRVVATNVTSRTAFGNAALDDPRNVTLRALISPEGLVYEYRLGYTATLAGERIPELEGDTVRVHRQVRYTHVGNTTVERPPWYDDAVENVSTPAPTAE